MKNIFFKEEIQIMIDQTKNNWNKRYYIVIVLSENFLLK